MKIVRSKQSDVKVKHGGPSFSYNFELEGQTIEMPDDHAEIICRNPDFEIVGDAKKKVCEFKQKLIKIKGIGDKTAKDIRDIYKTEQKLIEVIKAGKLMGLPDDIEILLKKHYGDE